MYAEDLGQTEACSLIVGSLSGPEIRFVDSVGFLATSGFPEICLMFVSISSHQLLGKIS